ncbi:MAG: hypothetical protein LUP97_06535 [Methanoregula sp.]|nr:hypothetical protein [Methanoregula sp.]
MSRIYGIQPRATTRKLVEKFEDEVIIRHNNQSLVGTVYVDINNDRWSVAFAYNYSRNPGLHGHENPLEVRYSRSPGQGSSIRMFRSDMADETLVETAVLSDADAFVSAVISHERLLVSRPV